MHRLLLLAPLALALCSADASARQSQFVPLGDLTGGTFQSSAYAVSADGSAVAGGGNGAAGTEAFLWTPSTGITGIGFIYNQPSRAYGISADGSVLAGYAGSSPNNEAFRWTAAGGMVGLGDLPGGNVSSYAYAVSADGATVVGASSSTLSTSQWVEAFRWTTLGGMQGLGMLPGGMPESLAFAASGDGSVIAGRSGGRAFRWTAATGMLDLGGVVGGTGSGEASGINAAGTVIVGRGGTSAGTEAFRWEAATGAVGLGDLPGGTYFSSANGVSDDGDVIVGYANYNLGVSDAFLWTPTLGMVNLQDHLVALGVTGLSGWSLRRAEAVSDDGTTIVGWGYNPSGSIEAFLVTLANPAPLNYCTAGTTSHGCNAAISGTGTPSASAPSGFTIAVNDVEGTQSGLIFYGLSGQASIPWGTGTSFMCVKSPLERTPVQNSGGTFAACDGALSLDWNLFVASNPLALGNPFAGGETVWAQGWFRDPPSPKTTSLSDGLEFVVAP